MVSRALTRPLALAVSLENVLLDVKELNRGMELTKREYSMHGHNTMLKDFITHNESKLKKLQDDAKIAQVTWARTPGFVIAPVPCFYNFVEGDGV